MMAQLVSVVECMSAVRSSSVLLLPAQYKRYDTIKLHDQAHEIYRVADANQKPAILKVCRVGYR